VLGWVNVGECVEDAQAAAEELLGERVTGGVLQDRVVRTGIVGATACGEYFRETLDLLDVGVLADQPDGVVALDDGLCHRHVVAQPFVGLVQRGEIGVALGEHELSGDFFGKNGWS
jgi:hypothetical protein